jgi:hypothetical protein
MWPLTPDVRCPLIFPQTFVNDLAQQVVFSSGQVFDLSDELGPHPIHAAEDQRQSKAAAARRRQVVRHFGHRERLEATPQPFKLAGVDAGAGAAGID